jgi:hypothetical protein
MYLMPFFDFSEKKRSIKDPRFSLKTIIKDKRVIVKPRS